MTAAITIRAATPDDAGAFLAHMKRLLNDPELAKKFARVRFEPTVEQMRENIREYYATLDNWTLLIAELNNQVIGSLSIHGGKTEDDRHSGLLSLYIEPEWRGHGLGKTLMGRTIEWAKETGILRRIELDVVSTNTPAVHLYEEHGFKTIRRRPLFDSTSNTVTAEIWIMELWLSPQEEKR